MGGASNGWGGDAWSGGAWKKSALAAPSTLFAARFSQAAILEGLPVGLAARRAAGGEMTRGAPGPGRFARPKSSARSPLPASFPLLVAANLV